MNAILDLGSEILIDRTQLRSPHMQMLLRAIGRPLARRSAWVVVKKQIAALYSLYQPAVGGALPKNHAA